VLSGVNALNDDRHRLFLLTFKSERSGSGGISKPFVKIDPLNSLGEA
jgi:hypothetical protein